MKISLRWLFDHLSVEYASIDNAALIDVLGQKVVEIEEVHTVSYAPHLFSVVRIEEIHKDSISALHQETQQTIQLPLRQNVEFHQYYFAKQINDAWQWTTLKDAGSSKDSLFNAISYHNDWQSSHYLDDTILTISNTAITHRPDLWSHRGFAREVVALLGCSLIPQEHLLSCFEYIYSPESTIKNSNYSLTIQAPQACLAFGLLNVTVANSESHSAMALRLASVDIKPISLLVDAGNYTMLDWGQPLHIFDRDKLHSSTFRLDFAKSNEHLMLLDGKTLKATPSMLMVYDDQTPVSLAGVMGGSSSAISSSTKNILIESACFDAHIVRKSAQQAQVRTDASSRFEKGLDQTLVLQGMERFVSILKEHTQISSIHDCVIVQKPLEQKAIKITHSELTSLLGVSLTKDFISTTLTALGFSVHSSEDVYTLQIPSWRLKDMSNAADIAEEVGRLYGWNNIATELPSLPLAPHEPSVQAMVMELKKLWAYTQHAHEVLNYPVWHEELFSLFKWQPVNQPILKNPVSHAAKTLVSSLIPHLVHNCIKNVHSPYKRLSFFEINAVWHQDKELTSWAVIEYNPQKVFNFAVHKQALCDALQALGYQLDIRTLNAAPCAWYDPHHCAQLFINNVDVGYAGRLSKEWSAHLSGHTFIAEINLDAVFGLSKCQITFKEPSKYQASWLDVSIMLTYATPIEQIIHELKKLDERIQNIIVQDIFTKEEWLNERSVTLRLIINDYTQQLTKSDLDALQAKVHHYCQEHALCIR